MLLKSRSYTAFRVGNILVRLQVRPLHVDGLVRTCIPIEGDGLPDVINSPCKSNLMELMKLPGLHGALGNTHLTAALRLKRQTAAGTALLRGRVRQASRTISAFTVVIITIAILWYVGASSCTSFFFAYQGFLPMQARPA